MSQLEFPQIVSVSNVAARRLSESSESHSVVPGVTAARALGSLLPAWWLVGLGGVGVVALLCAAVLGAGECRVQPLPLSLGAESTVSFVTPADTPCTITISAPSSAIDGIAIDTPPRHGTVTARGRTGATYRPASKFKGEDSFTFSMHRGFGSEARVAVVRVRTSVR